MSFRTDDDTALLLAFLAWYDQHGDTSLDNASLAAEFIAEREKTRQGQS